MEVPEGYGDVVEGTLLRHLPRVKINFARLAMTATNILLLGFPTAERFVSPIGDSAVAALKKTVLDFDKCKYAAVLCNAI